MKLALEAEDIRALARALAEELRGPAADEWTPLAGCGVSVRTLRAAIKAGELPASKVGREYRVRRADLTAWMTGRRVEPRQTEQTPAERAIARAANAGRLRRVL
jgi:excisionase family DNA binding protein